MRRWGWHVAAWLTGLVLLAKSTEEAHVEAKVVLIVVAVALMAWALVFQYKMEKGL